MLPLMMLFNSYYSISQITDPMVIYLLMMMGKYVPLMHRFDYFP